MATVAQIKPPQQTAVDDGVRERHGCDTRNGSFCQIREDGDAVFIAVKAGLSEAETGMRPARARYLARKLHRLARRVEQRELLA